ncbi:MAG: DUF4178 domain-containing protein [Pseudomonadota bacterium]
MRGTIHDVEFVIIGIVQWRTTDGYAWLEFQIFSPTHGYAWLEFFKGHYIFSRRVRDLPKSRITPRAKSTFSFKDRSFTVFERYAALIIYVEGELTFIAKEGDRVQVLDAIDPPYLVSVESHGEQEEEYVLGEYLEPDVVHQAFKLPAAVGKRYDVHPAQPFKASPLSDALNRIGKYFAAGAALIVLALWLFGGGNEVLRAQFSDDIYAGNPQYADFELSGTKRLLKLELFSPLQNAWAAFDIVVKQGDAEVFSMGKQLSYYSGIDGGESWSEGSRSAEAYFKLPNAGAYRLVVNGEKERRRTATGNANALKVTIHEGVVVSRYFIAMLGITIVAVAWLPLSRLRFESRQWEYEDDDDD